MWPIQRGLGSQRSVPWRLSWGEHAFLWAERIQRSEASGEMLWHILHGVDEGDGSEPEQSCRFLFQMVRVSSQSFLFLFTRMCLVISYEKIQASVQSPPCEQDVRSHSSVKVSPFLLAGAKAMCSYYSLHAEQVQT